MNTLPLLRTRDGRDVVALSHRSPVLLVAVRHFG